ncbi:MAG TPA: restriction endonuclease, partial [bacterium]|nr:restriction endonuclease [bacterium]
MKNTGKEYEIFVASLYQAILNAEEITTQKNIKVEIDKKIIDRCGIERQFDIYWEYEMGGITYKTAIECKDYTSNISVEKIDALIGKIHDLPDLRAIFATKKGYQSGAKTKAEQNKIDLLIVREQNDLDWTDKDGNPLVKRISMKLNLRIPAVIYSFEPFIDGDWVKANTDLDTNSLVNIEGLNNEIFIDDIDNGERYSLHELSSKLSKSDEKEYGTFEKTEEFEEAYLYHKDLKLKLKSYKLKYSLSKPMEM